MTLLFVVLSIFPIINVTNAVFVHGEGERFCVRHQRGGGCAVFPACEERNVRPFRDYWPGTAIEFARGNDNL
jgi:hypothetical protein